MTTITIERALLKEVVDIFDNAISTRYPHEILRDIRAALSATAPAAASESLMTEIDYADDDALRFIQRVLESDAPESDKKSARDMVVEIRTRVLKARTSKPAAAPATAPEQMPLERDCICHQDLHIDGYSGGAAPEGLYGALWVVVEGVGKKYVLADQSSEPKDMLAPATAPAQPEIVDLLAEMYELILANKVVLAEKSGGVWTWPDRAIEAVRKHRSGPAQPERKPTTDAQCIELFHKVQRGMGFKDHDVIPFISGVAAGEHFHGIKETP